MKSIVISIAVCCAWAQVANLRGAVAMQLQPAFLLNATTAVHQGLNATASTSSACNAVCNGVTKAVTCTAGCEGVDKGICKGSDYILCKGGCLGISSCVKKCEKKIVDPCVKKLVDECDDSCVKTVVAPCISGCEKKGLAICEEAVGAVVNKIEKKGITEVCVEAAALADAAGAGPEDPVADAVATLIGITCKPALTEAVKELLPTAKVSAYVCGKIGF
jgi:hypothetical protein